MPTRKDCLLFAIGPAAPLVRGTRPRGTRPCTWPQRRVMPKVPPARVSAGAPGRQSGGRRRCQSVACS